MSYSNKILITGGLGFIGQNFAKHCLKNKFKIDIIDIKQKPKIADILFDFKKINYSKINLSNKKKLITFLRISNMTM
ncbi:NAD(P)-dependent oxidoreductase [Candidatus Pelagibacter giovannonii]|uniref:NAD(P)-dependent oxidoreductase n=1 Tax=Candidatus Pelagibacter giovannonii TaxID=2563896 RepID=A0A6H1Q2C4_9PROT|nr:NAD(P)-dependent oxidoreductase [Candidatus Pelagibacter giovannonii]QIZ20856.1 NAD(P)-dependent oxidoreductase [Candidatus Pelagibacter giovannonii]